MSDGAAAPAAPSPEGSPAPSAGGAAPAASWLNRTPVGEKLTAVIVAFVAIIAATLAILVLALKISSGVRAYVAGEGLWSRAQKDAVLALERYAHTGEAAHFHDYERAIAVILGDRQARLELERPQYDPAVAADGFVRGGNHPADIPDMIFLFRYFRRVSYLDAAIADWTEGDAIADRLFGHAQALRLAVEGGADGAAKQRIVEAIWDINQEIAALELHFSATLASGARAIHGVLLAGSFLLTALLAIAGVALARRIAAHLRTAIGRLQEGTARVAAGDYSQAIRVQSGDELGALARAFNGMLEQRREAARALEERLAFESLVAQLSSGLTRLTADRADDGINRALADIGRFAQVDRSYIFGFDEAHTTVTCTHEWCAPGVAPQIERLQSLLTADYPWVTGRLGRGEIVHVPRLVELPPEAAAERREWELESIRSLLLIPMRSGDVIRGYIGFDSVRAEKEWPAALQDVLRVFGEIVLNTLTRVRAEQALRERNQKLAATIHELERSNADLEEFAYVASHDLRTPLRGINGFIQLLRRKLKGQLDAESEEFIGLALKSVDQMQALIGGLLTLSRIGKGDVRAVPTNCEEVLQDVTGHLAPLIAERGVELTHESLPTVTATPLELRQLLENLVANAIKFQPGPRPRVHVAAIRDGAWWKFSVRDWGIGIKAEHQQKIFQIFQRLHGQDAFEGSGIGLAVCRKIVARHGGRLWVESVEGQGSTFYFTLRA